jgi:hypothetical protein
LQELKIQLPNSNQVAWIIVQIRWPDEIVKKIMSTREAGTKYEYLIDTCIHEFIRGHCNIRTNLNKRFGDATLLGAAALIHRANHNRPGLLQWMGTASNHHKKKNMHKNSTCQITLFYNLS